MELPHISYFDQWTLAISCLFVLSGLHEVGDVLPALQILGIRSLLFFFYVYLLSSFPRRYRPLCVLVSLI